MTLTQLFWVCCCWVILSVSTGILWAILFYEKPKDEDDLTRRDTRDSSLVSSPPRPAVGEK